MKTCWVGHIFPTLTTDMQIGSVDFCVHKMIDWVCDRMAPTQIFKCFEIPTSSHSFFFFFLFSFFFNNFLAHEPNLWAENYISKKISLKKWEIIGPYIYIYYYYYYHHHQPGPKHDHFYFFGQIWWQFNFFWNFFSFSWPKKLENIFLFYCKCN